MNSSGSDQPIIPYAFLFESSPGALIVFDSQGEIRDHNAAARQLFGRTAQGLAGLTFTELLGIPFPSGINPATGQPAESVPQQQEKLILRAQAIGNTGSSFPVIVELHSLLYSGEQFTLAQIQDATIQDQLTDEFYRQDAVLASLSFAAERLLGSPQWAEEIPAILQRLGTAALSQRVSLFTRNAAGDFVLEHEWAAPGIHPYTAGDHMLIERFLSREEWLDQLAQGEAVASAADRLPAADREACSKLGIQSLCLVPVLYSQTWWGLLWLEDREHPREWSPGEIDVLHTAANLFAQAAQRQHTEKILQQRQQYLTLLNDITLAALQQEDFQATLDVLAVQLQDLFQADSCYITLWNEQKQWAFPAAASGPDRAQYPRLQTDPGEATITLRVLEQNDVLVLDDYQNAELISPRIRSYAQDIRSLMAIPLVANQRRLGAAILAYQKPFQQNQRSKFLARQIAAQIALILSKVSLFEETHRQLEELRLLQEIVQEVNTTLDEDELITRISRIVSRRIYRANFGFYLLDEETKSLHPHPSYLSTADSPPSPHLRLGQGVVGKVAETGKTLYIADTCHSDLYIGDCSTFRSELCVPLRLGEKILGVINVESRQGDDFSEADIRLVETIAGQTATAVHKLRLFQLERQRRQEAEMLRQVTGSLAASLDIDEVLNEMLDELERVVPFDSASLMLNTKNGLQIVAAHYYHPGAPRLSPPGMQRYSHIHELREQRQALIISDTKQDPRWHPVPGTEYIGSWLGVPLIVKNQVIGILNLDKIETHFYTPRLLEIASTFASQAAIAIENARLYAELESAYLQTVLSLARAVDARDSYTAGHSHRIRDLANMVGQALGCQEEEIRNLQWAALLHDIGKIGVPDEVLRKPGPLSSDEWKIMKRHPDIGAEIISPVSKLEEVVPIVRHHQEKFDGSGYPAGLAGQAIPSGARILSVVDAYTAITDERVYRPARSHQEAVIEIMRCRGSQFDPQVVDALLEILDSEWH